MRDQLDYDEDGYPHNGWTRIPDQPSFYDQEFRDIFNADDAMWLESVGIEPYAEVTWTKD